MLLPPAFHDQLTAPSAPDTRPAARGISRACEPPCPPERAETGRSRLKQAGLRPTWQRLILAKELFSGDARHLTAEELFRKAERSGKPLSLATVYNTLRTFMRAGLIREIAIGNGPARYDAGVRDHHHFHLWDEDRLIDIAPGTIRFERLPEPPAGCLIVAVDVVIRLRRVAPQRQEYDRAGGRIIPEEA